MDHVLLLKVQVELVQKETIQTLLNKDQLTKIVFCFISNWKKTHSKLIFSNFLTFLDC